MRQGAQAIPATRQPRSYTQKYASQVDSRPITFHSCLITGAGLYGNCRKGAVRVAAHTLNQLLTELVILGLHPAGTPPPPWER